jgi:hypothetical protein
MREQGRTDQVDADAADELGGAGACQLLLHDEVVERSRTSAAVLDGPRHAYQVRVCELTLPSAQVRDFIGKIVESGRKPLAVFPWQVCAQPRARLSTECVLFGGGRQVHDRLIVC